MKDMMRKINAKDRMNANSSWRVSELLAADCKKKNVAPPRMGGYNAEMV